jgi:hypothetical protein
VADVKYPYTGTDSHMLVDNAAAQRCWVFDRHVPAIELNHLRAHLAVDGI